MVLLADDDEDARSLIARTVRKAGFEVHEVSDGASLLAKARSLFQDEQQVTLVLSDINMPEPDGLAVTPQLLALEPTLHIVLMSAFADASVVRAARELGVKRVLRKPFAVSLVVQILASLST